MTDAMLLEQYAQTGSQEAFGELVSRHTDWVYSAALRMVRDHHLAQDVTQAVFLVLWQKGKTLGDKPLNAWLFGVVRYSAAHALRTKGRRERVEREAAKMAQRAADLENQREWDEVASMLDEKVARLGQKDQRAILLRFYERKSMMEVGESLGVSEDAAKKRVARAVEKLRLMFGPASGIEAGALSVALLAKTTLAAPAILAPACVSTSSAAAASVSTIAKGATSMMFTAQMKIAAAVVATICLVPAGIGVVAIVRAARSSPVANVTPVAVPQAPVQAAPQPVDAPPSPPPATEPSNQEVMNRVKCASNMRQIGQGILLYTNENRWAYPPDLGTLGVTEDIPLRAFLCPDTGKKAPQNLPLDQVRAWVNANTDYIYMGQGLKQGVDPRVVVLCEKDTNHAEAGMNLLFGDGHVEFRNMQSAKDTIDKSNEILGR